MCHSHVLLQTRTRPHTDMFECSHLFPCKCVSGQFDLGEVALADGLEEAVVPHLGLVVRRGRHGLPVPGRVGTSLGVRMGLGERARGRERERKKQRETEKEREV